jgi:hypothetical protein
MTARIRFYSNLARFFAGQSAALYSVCLLLPYPQTLPAARALNITEHLTEKYERMA